MVVDKRKFRVFGLTTDLLIEDFEGPLNRNLKLQLIYIPNYSYLYVTTV